MGPHWCCPITGQDQWPCHTAAKGRSSKYTDKKKNNKKKNARMHVSGIHSSARSGPSISVRGEFSSVSKWRSAITPLARDMFENMCKSQECLLTAKVESRVKQVNTSNQGRGLSVQMMPMCSVREEEWKLLMHVSFLKCHSLTLYYLCVCVCVEEVRGGDAFKCLSSGVFGKMEQAVICIHNSRTRATLTERKGSLWRNALSHIHIFSFCLSVQMRTFLWYYSIHNVSKLVLTSIHCSPLFNAQSDQTFY